MSGVIEGLAKSLQERVNEAEPEVERLRRENAELREALRPFAEANRWDTPAINVSRKHFARAAELVPDTSQG